MLLAKLCLIHPAMTYQVRPISTEEQVGIDEIDFEPENSDRIILPFLCQLAQGLCQQQCENNGYIGQCFFFCDCGTYDPCNPNPCQNNGTCSAVDGNYKCECTAGFTGEKCDMNDPCKLNPCRNGGTCTAKDAGTYTCECMDGFEGMNCSGGDGPADGGSGEDGPEDGDGK